MTFEKLSQAEELRDRRDAWCEKLQDLMLMRTKANDCAEDGEVWVAVGSRSSLRCMHIDTNLVDTFLSEVEQFYTDKKQEVEDEFAKL